MTWWQIEKRWEFLPMLQKKIELCLILFLQPSVMFKLDFNQNLVLYIECNWF